MTGWCWMLWWWWLVG